jgi:superfamily II DNA or RNA helicase
VKVSENGKNFILHVPISDRKEIANLMAYRGLTFSTSASSRNEAVLFSLNPYSLADIADESLPTLGPYRQQIEKSRALDGKGTRRLPPGKELWDYQKATLDFLLERGGGINGDQPGLGKRLPLSEPILTPFGWRKNSDLHAGAWVYGHNGQPVQIEAVHRPQKSRVWKVVFSDGRYVRCDAEHLWEVERRGGCGFKTEVLTTQQIMDWGLTVGGGTRNGVPRQIARFYVPLVQPIQYAQKNFDIHPYLLGALIGDGALTGTKVALSCPDQDIEIVQNAEKCLPNGFHFVENRHPNCPQYIISNPTKGAAFHHMIAALGLNVKSPERFIPENYLMGSVNQRQDLLAGLMDTDGSCSRNRTVYHTKSSRLAEDIAQLVRSLGGWAKVRVYKRSDDKGTDYQVNVKTHFCPFYLVRKADQWRPSNIKLAISEIVPDGEEFQRCIKIADPRGLFVTRGYTLTHNTPTSIAYCNEREAQRVLVIVPASVRLQWAEQIKAWSTIPGVKVSTMLKVKDGIHPTAHYQIISYEAARNPAIIRAISKYEWDVLICDEAHKMKNIDALTTRAVIGNSRGDYHHGDHKMKAISHYCRERLALTGTILLNRPSECYVLFRFFDWEAIDFASEEKFKERYNRQADLKTIEGKRFKLESTSLESELQNRLRVNVMARHEKKDVLTFMKPPRYAVVRCEESGNVRSALDAEGLLDISIDDIQTTKDFEILGHIAQVRRLMGIALAPQIADYARDFLEGSDEKLVIFGWHLEVLDIFENELSRFGTVRVDGRKSPAARQKAVDDFINQSNVRVFIGNIQAAGTGLDGLQKVCSRCYLAEPDWVPAQNEQAVSRLDRFGQENVVTAEIFVAPGSISEKILVRALEKMNTIHKVLDHREGN